MCDHLAGWYFEMHYNVLFQTDHMPCMYTHTLTHAHTHTRMHTQHTFRLFVQALSSLVVFGGTSTEGEFNDVWTLQLTGRICSK